eukprot:TRINITY_DN9426_c0_g1_i3.p1 TRINITY_DN9426_c0_g1~~TRINITY_DN9426_c0_g1_i3.p1  ORF type:complete len:169 (-),score=35.91 TRINITY_DN9426_c0_g1_i3:140-646(-)
MSQLADLKKLRPYFEPPGDLAAATFLYMVDEGLIVAPEAISLLTDLKELNFYDNKLTTLPDSYSALTNLSVLGIGRNQFSEIPAFASQLRSLSSLYIEGNPISEIPSWITCLSRLERFLIEFEGSIQVKSAPSGITSLPCWSCEEKPWDIMKKTFAESLRSLDLRSDM